MKFDFNKIEKGAVIMMSGDSVTDAGRAYPVGNYRTGMGSGYVNRIHEAITAVCPEKEIKVLNLGISGEKSRDVAARWVANMETYKPDYATLMIGVNDVWRSYDTYLDKEIAVDIEEYEKHLRFILENSKNLKGMLLISPIFFELNKEDIFMKRIADYSAVCKRLAEEYQVDYLDLQPEIDRLCSAFYTTTFSGDRVHPGPVAHFAIARAILKHINFEI